MFMSRALVVLCASCVLFFQFFSLTYCQTFQYSRGWTNGKRSLDKVEESSDESEPVAPGMILDRPSRHPRHQATKLWDEDRFYKYVLTPKNVLNNRKEALLSSLATRILEENGY